LQDLDISDTYFFKKIPNTIKLVIMNKYFARVVHYHRDRFFVFLFFLIKQKLFQENVYLHDSIKTLITRCIWKKIKWKW